MMDKKEVEKKVKEVLEERLKIKNVTSDSHFVNDLGLDSFNMVELLYEVEEVFGISIPEEDLRNINTVGEIVEYIFEKISRG